MARGRNAGNRGQGSNWIQRAKRLRIYARDDHQCVWCGAREHLTLDHLLPRSHGGSNHHTNLFTACMRCNRERGNEPLWAFANRLFGELRTLAVLQACARELPS